MSDGAKQTFTETSGQIETIFWDIGGVLLTNGWDAGQRTRVLTSLGVDLQAYEVAHERENWFWERGLISAEQFFDRTVLTLTPALILRLRSSGRWFAAKARSFMGSVSMCCKACRRCRVSAWLH